MDYKYYIHSTITDCAGDFCCRELFCLIFTGVARSDNDFNIDSTNNLKVFFENLYDKIFQKHAVVDDIKLRIETYEDIDLSEVENIPTNRVKFYNSIRRFL